MVVWKNHSSPKIAYHLHEKQTTTCLKVLKESLLRSRQVRLVRWWLILNVPVRIKMRGVEWVLDSWNPWCWNLLVEELVHVNHVEPRVIANVHITTSQTSETIGLTTDNEALDQILCLLVDSSAWWERVLDLDDALEQTDLISSVGVEWRASDQHLVDQDTKGPVVNTLVVTLRQNNLGSKVLWSTAKSVGLVDHNLCETKIDKHAVSPAIDEDVLGLQITVADTSVVKVTQGFEDTGGVEARVCVWNTISRLSVNDGKQLSTLYQFD
mmetsp:Transcript_6696/g.11038  ORF Transcript_6696/g.11038 Transcript_6696/m.11038 type:complete len:268 (+) Transcript_6696:75-878(+)